MITGGFEAANEPHMVHRFTPPPPRQWGTYYNRSQTGRDVSVSLPHAKWERNPVYVHCTV